MDYSPIIAGLLAIIIGTIFVIYGIILFIIECL